MINFEFPTVIYWISNIIFVFCNFTFLNKFLGSVRINKGLCLIAAVAYSCTIAYNYYNFNNFLINLITNILLVFVISFLFKGEVWERLIAAVLTCILALACETGTAVGICIAYRITLSVALQDTFYIMLGMIFSKIFLLILSVSLGDFIGRNKNNEVLLPMSYWLLIVLIPAGAAFILHVLFQLQLQLASSSSIDKYTILIEIAIVVVFLNVCFTFYLYDRLLNSGKIQLQNKFLIRQVNYNAQQNALTKVFAEESKNRQHDLKNHLSIIYTMAANGKTDEIKNYVVALSDGVTPIFAQGVISGNLAVDVILGNKLYEAEQQRITVDKKIAIPEVLKISETDTSILLGNLLDNAIEACIRLPNVSDRRIFLSMTYKQSNLIIIISNTYKTETLNKKGERYLTSKPIAEGHGRGLTSIKQIIKKYHGTIIITQSETEQEEISQFKANIIIFV